MSSGREYPLDDEASHHYPLRIFVRRQTRGSWVRASSFGTWIDCHHHPSDST
ncbi:hypothetical protein FKM82_004164 [Ascaphus truei]